MMEQESRKAVSKDALYTKELSRNLVYIAMEKHIGLLHMKYLKMKKNCQEVNECKFLIVCY